jgi:hypothetical protein
MGKYFVVSRWWDHVYGWYLWLRRRPRCANSPFEPPPRTTASTTTSERDDASS